jgi:hypothetical protein
MTDDNKIQDIQNAWKKMEAEEASKKVLKENTDVSSPTAKKFSIKDDHSKAVSGVNREMGSEDGAKKAAPDTHGSEKSVEGAKPIDRKEGAKAGNAEVKGDEGVHGTKKAESTANPVKREEGSGDSVQKYAAFRSRIKATLGLSLDDAINKTGTGLNASPIAGKTKTK